MRYEEIEQFGIRACVYKPINYSAAKKYPCILFLHGAGHCGDELIVKNHSALLKIVKKEPEAIVVAPQCKGNTWFNVFGDLMNFTAFLYQQQNIEQNKFYGIGNSMGGYAMVQLMECCPQFFAGGIICCGGGMYWNATRLVKISLKLFHGKADTIIFPEESERLYDEIIARGGTADIILYDNCGHNCWDRAFDDVNTIDWLLKQRCEE